MIVFVGAQYCFMTLGTQIKGAVVPLHRNTMFRDKTPTYVGQNTTNRGGLLFRNFTVMEGPIKAYESYDHGYPGKPSASEAQISPKSGTTGKRVVVVAAHFNLKRGLSAL
eukprot:2475040-Rhodomonas_salina.3